MSQILNMTDLNIRKFSLILQGPGYTWDRVMEGF